MMFLKAPYTIPIKGIMAETDAAFVEMDFMISLLEKVQLLFCLQGLTDGMTIVQDHILLNRWQVPFFVHDRLNYI